MFAGMDSPQSPSKRGSRAFKYHITDHMRQTFRERLFAVSRVDIRNAADKYLRGESAICVLGTEQHRKEVDHVADFEHTSMDQLGEKLNRK